MLNARTQQRRTSDLETRITNRKQEMIAEIVEHKKNSSRAGAADEVDKIKTRLTELAQIVKEEAQARGLGLALNAR
jgi:hypothetical protein